MIVNCLRSSFRSLGYKLKDMKATRTVEINQIIFESNDTDVLIKGTIRHDHMFFNTDILISNSMLNRIACELQKNNEGFSFNDNMNSEKIDFDVWQYSICLDQELNRIIDLSSLSPEKELRKIRA